MEQLNIDSYISAIDSKDLNKLENLINNKIDIIFELYNSDLLNKKHLNFIMKNCTKCLNISSNLVKRLIKDKKISLQDIIFSSNTLKFYDNNFILQLLLHYKNKTEISTQELKYQISNEKFKILTSKNYSNNVGKYLIDETNKNNINIYYKVFS